MYFSLVRICRTVPRDQVRPRSVTKPRRFRAPAISALVGYFDAAIHVKNGSLEANNPYVLGVDEYYPTATAYMIGLGRFFTASAASAVAGHGSVLTWDRGLTPNVDPECELGVVIGVIDPDRDGELQRIELRAIRHALPQYKYAQASRQAWRLRLVPLLPCSFCPRP